MTRNLHRIVDGENVFDIQRRQRTVEDVSDCAQICRWAMCDAKNALAFDDRHTKRSLIY